MSHLSNLFGAPAEPDHVRVGAWQLCAPCSKARHVDHETLTRCQCDLCTAEQTTPDHD